MGGKDERIGEVRFLTVRDVANLLQVSVRQVYRLVQRRLLPQPVKVGRCTRFDARAIEVAVARLPRS
ncbi:MAG: helix-turn-helix transcriptional regulator [Phycisphaerales bacterium]